MTFYFLKNKKKCCKEIHAALNIGEHYYNETELSEDRALSSPKRYKMTFEECVLAKDPACTYPIGSQVALAEGEKSFISQVKFFFLNLG